MGDFKYGVFMKLAIFVLVSLLSTVSFAFPIVPDPELTTGELCTRDNPDYTEDRYNEHIPYCTRNVETRLKNQIYDKYGIPKECRYRYTIDHFIPLSLGGDNAEANLWPEHRLVKATRQNLEEQLYNQLKRGQISQKAAVDLIYHAKTSLKHVETGSDHCDQ